MLFYGGNRSGIDTYGLYISKLTTMGTATIYYTFLVFIINIFPNNTTKKQRQLKYVLALVSCTGAPE